MEKVLEDISYSTCERCGDIQGIIHTSGCVRTLCRDCFDRRDNETT